MTQEYKTESHSRSYELCFNLLQLRSSDTARDDTWNPQ